jgi:hypothetical protein
MEIILATIIMSIYLIFQTCKTPMYQAVQRAKTFQNGEVRQVFLRILITKLGRGRLRLDFAGSKFAILL